MGRRVRHLNYAHLGAALTLDPRFLSVAEGASVTSMADRGTSGRTVSNSGTARPTMGYPWLVFDDAFDQELLGSDTGLPTGQFFLSVVSRTEETGGLFDPVLTYGTNTTGQALMLNYSSDQLNADVWGFSITQSGSQVNQSIISRYWRTATDRFLSFNGGSTVSDNTLLGTVVPRSGTDGLAIGGYGWAATDRNLTGRIGSIVLFGSVPSSSLQKRVAHSQAFAYKIAHS